MRFEEEIDMTVHAATHSADEVRSLEFLAGGSLSEVIGGAAALVLAILALAGVLPATLAAVSIIALGTAMLFKGGAVTARLAELNDQLATNATEEAELVGGMTAETMTGIAGIVLGILALLGVAPMALMSVSLLVFGGGLLFASAANTELNELRIGGDASVRERQALRASVNVASGSEVLVGLGAAVLGILALVGLAPLTLTLVGLLSIGASVLFAGSALGGKMAAILRH
jgi:hypothetical protein